MGSGVAIMAIPARRRTAVSLQASPAALRIVQLLEGVPICAVQLEPRPHLVRSASLRKATICAGRLGEAVDPIAAIALGEQPSPEGLGEGEARAGVSRHTSYRTQTEQIAQEG